jgi:hypothetical protein
MKKLFFIPIFLFSMIHVFANNEVPILGSWTAEQTIGEKTYRHLLLFSGNYFSHSVFESKDGSFVMTRGGSFSSSGNESYGVIVEFNSADPSTVGAGTYVNVSVKEGKLYLSGVDGIPTEWMSDEKNSSTALTGPWLFSGRKNDNGEIERRGTDGPRKTMKIITGSKFHWIAYNTDTREFFGSGGGTYEAVDGKYTEKIEFFSRDNSRVGASLSFDFKVEDADWHHSGLSSQGKPIYEVWSKR